MAIAFDTATKGYTGGATTLTVSHTTAGTERALLVSLWTAGATERVTGVTYGGAAMTQLVKKQDAASGWCYVYGLLAPAVGSNNVVVSVSASIEMAVINLSYSNVKQSGLPDATASFEDLAKTSPLRHSVTTVADNCFVVGFVHFPNLALTAEQTARYSNGTSMFAADTGPVTPAWSTELGWTFTGTITDCVTLMVSIAPVPTSIKTINGLAIASVKSINGLAIASVKTINGLS